MTDSLCENAAQGQPWAVFVLLRWSRQNKTQLHYRLGVVKKGSYADLVAYTDSPYKDLDVMNHAAFVMKDGTVCKDETKVQ